MIKILTQLVSLSNQLDLLGHYTIAEAIDNIIKIASVKISPETKERFWAKVDKSPKYKGCWIWVGARDSGGYGMVTIDGKNYNAHKLAWEWAHKRKVPKGLVLLHMCDNINGPCVKPSHLITGTQKNNVEDRVKKDRSAKGGQNGRAKLKNLDIKKIRKLRRDGWTESRIALLFGIGRSTVSNILHSRTWNWL